MLVEAIPLPNENKDEGNSRAKINGQAFCTAEWTLVPSRLRDPLAQELRFLRRIKPAFLLVLAHYA
jgi:hypothetical protein